MMIFLFSFHLKKKKNVYIKDCKKSLNKKERRKEKVIKKETGKDPVDVSFSINRFALNWIVADIVIDTITLN